MTHKHRFHIVSPFKKAGSNPKGEYLFTLICKFPNLTGAEITGVAGDQEGYKVSLTKADKVSELDVAAIVVRPAQSRIEKNKTND